ncbi:NAD(P)H-binding protein [Isoptericola sp. S6320L]|uniref:NAD(P)-dependent oxidoreductase n=1 Tax=Isoptericola sp. S6320L TaxID=2926411 RepID=UPI001FF2BFFA|nr:NAD(P)H-binding protein [Isoptericola sp. S6320L]MCK0117853.1 NAD(P)H-binding protein [Isoptericola sp. S6320L]
MARITVIGGTGYAGTHIVREAAARGHEVRSLSRSAPAERVDGAEYTEGSVLDDDAIAAALDGTDVVVASVSPRGDMAGQVRPAYARLAAAAQERGVRLAVVGGASSLQVAEGGPRLLDTPEFPDAFKDEAAEFAAILDDLRGASPELDWFYLSPAATFGAYAPGEDTGSYRVGGDVLLTDDAGESAISGPDFARALVDEIETPAHRRTRFTVAH